MSAAPTLTQTLRALGYESRVATRNNALGHRRDVVRLVDDERVGTFSAHEAWIWLGVTEPENDHERDILAGAS